jgi:hypothetical protein
MSKPAYLEEMERAAEKVLWELLDKINDEGESK